MLDRLPAFIDPLNFAERGRRIVGAIEISQLTRLSEILLNNSGLVEIDLSFDKERSLSVIEGKIKAILSLECQSCAEQLDYSIDRNFKLGVVNSLEQSDKLQSDCEPFILETEKVSLNELIEDEILLELPDFPKHNHDCVKKHDEKSNNAFIESQNKETEQLSSNNPFSVLAKLKNTGD